VNGDFLYGDASTQGGYDGDDLIMGGTTGEVDFGTNPAISTKSTQSQYSAADDSILGVLATLLQAIMVLIP